jgi:uncharacterized membrane protein YbhN (UPF0104 family)
MSPDGSDGSVAPPGADRPQWWTGARIAAFVLLAVFTFYGIYSTFSGDFAEMKGFWAGKLGLLPWLLALALFDVILEWVAWVWVYERFGMRARGATGARVFLAAHAGLFLPAQLGRLIRPDAMVRLGRGTMAKGMKAEAAVFVIDALAVFALLAGVAAWLIHPLLTPLAAALVIVACLSLGNLIAERLAGTPLGLPRAFWWSTPTVAIVLIEMLGWTTHGFSFYLLVRDLPGSIGIWDSLFFAPAAAVLGVGSGLPGGIGATEGMLGAALRFADVPATVLPSVVGGFRLVTFWIWIPIGWFALASTRRRQGRHAVRVAEGTHVPKRSMKGFADESPSEAVGDPRP